MNGGLRLVEPLRRGDVKSREGGCEQFRAKHARNVNGFGGSHADADESDFILPVMYPSGSSQAVGFSYYKCAQHAPMACDLRDNLEVAKQ